MIHPEERPDAAASWRNLTNSLEGGSEFGAFWRFGRDQPPQPDGPFYLLNSRTVLRYEPSIFEYASLMCSLTRSKKYFNEDGYKVLRTIKGRSCAAREIAGELGDESDSSIDAIEAFLDPLVEEGLVLKAKYSISPRPPPSQETDSPSSEFPIPYPSAPYFTMIYLTYNCNLKCKHCGLSCDLTMNNLSGSQWVKIFDLLERGGISTVTLNGGEPLLHPDIDIILKRLARSPFWVRVFTNGTVLTDEKVEHISRGRNFYVSISLDGANAATHDDFRGKPGTFEKIIESFERLNRAPSDIVCKAACVIHKKNLDQFEDLIELALQYNLQGVHFVSMNYLGKAQTEGYYISVQKHPEILTSIMDTAKKYEDKLPITIQGRGPTLKDFDRPAPEYFNHTFTCNAGVLDWMIDPVGDVFPCETIVALKKEQRDQFYLGNISSESMSKIWNSPNYHVFRGGYDESNLTMCTQCSFYELCGDKVCRLYALATTGNFDGPAYECRFSQKDLGIPIQKKG